MTTKTHSLVKALLAAALLNTGVSAATINGVSYNDSAPTGYLLAQRIAATGDVRTGEWHADLDKCLAFANQHGIPLIAVWSNGDSCGHCMKFENNALSVPFREWMAKSGVVFYFGYYDDPGKGATLGEWCYWCGSGNPIGKTLPLFRVYWPKGGLDRAINGDEPDGNKGRCTIKSESLRDDEPYYRPGDYDTYNPGGRYMAQYFSNILINYDGSGANSYYGGDFTTVNNPNAGLQAVAGVTPRVNIPLWRTNSTSVAKAYTNLLWGVYPNGSSFTNTIAWAAGQKTVLVPIDITKSNRVSASDAGKAIRLVLYDSKKKKVADYANGVTIVSPEAYPNSPGNPLWLGERTADTLEFGEWTMDLDAVTNKVKAWNAALGRSTAGKKAYSLIYVGGSRWCPDCVMADKYFFDDARFQTWAQKCNIALGVIDIPSDPTQPSQSPSLLTYNTFSASDNYVTARKTQAADETQRIQSGAPYISRKGIVLTGNNGTNANDIATRNRLLVSRNTLNGGWNRPERPNQTRTGVPCLIALRDNGTIAGRWEFFSDLGPSGWSDGYLRRIEELLSQADGEEEFNQNWRTTKETIQKRGVSRVATLSHSDLVDTYKIEPAATGQTVSFKIHCASDVQGTLKIVQASDLLEKTLAEQSGLFSGSIEVTAEIPSNNCYLVVAADVISSSKPATPVSPALAATKATSTVFDYFISSDNVLAPTEGVLTETVSDGDNHVTLATEAGTSYKITNLDTAAIQDDFDIGVGEDIYIAKKTGSCTLTLKDKDAGAETYSVQYQIWKTGKIGFEQSGASVKEETREVEYQIKVVREGGASGKAQATLVLDRTDERCAWIARLEAIGQAASVFSWEYADPIQLDWGDGEADEKTFTVKVNPNTNADGDLQLVFRLTKGESDAGLDIDEFVLQIRDDDEPVPGTLAIAGTTPECAKAMTLVAKAGSPVTIHVARWIGSDGEVTGTLKTTAGTFANGLDEIVLTWPSRDADAQSTELTLPAALEGTDTVCVTLTSGGGAQTDYEAKTLLVKVAAAESLSFTDAEKNVEALRHVPIEPIEIAVAEKDGIDWASVNVVKYAGSLAPGLAWKYDADKRALVIDGVPMQSGWYAASYRVYRGDEPGLACVVYVSVRDLAAGSASEAPLNASLSQARTFNDILVINQTAGRLAGLMTLTIPPSGRLSAKYRAVDGRTISYLSPSWSSCDPVTYAVAATLSGVRDEDAGLSMTVTANSDGTVEIAGFSDPKAAVGDEHDFVFPAVDDERFAPKNWEGYYTTSLLQTNALSASLPLTTGDGYVVLKMTDAAAIAMGKMTYAGVLPNGKAFSGSGMLVPSAFDSTAGEYARALLPVLSAGSSDSLTGVLSLKPYAKSQHRTSRRSVYAHSDVPFVWSHVDVDETVSWEVQFNAFGGYYDSTESLAECCEATFETLNLTFFALPELLTQEALFSSGAPLAWSTNSTGVGVQYNDATHVNRLGLLRASQAKADNGLTFSYAPETGLVSGSLRLVFENGSAVTAIWRGVVMPGWGTGCGECTLGNDEALERPFISGAFWFSDVYHYVDGRSRVRTLSVKRGAPISVGVNPGE